MVVSNIPAEISEILTNMQGYLGFGLITYNGIPKVVDLSKKLSIKEEKVFSTMCATIMGASDVLGEVISPQEKKHTCICIHYEDYQLVLAQCKKKNVFVFLAIERQDDMTALTVKLDEIIAHIDEAKLML